MIGVEGPFQSKHAPVTRPRFGKSSSKGNKSIDSTRSDDSLTSLEWLSTMGNPTTPVLSVVPEPPKYNVYDLVSLAFRLARKAVLSLSEICEMACRLNPHLTKDHIYHELSTNNEFISHNGGWKMTCSSMPTEAKKRRVEYDENLNHLDSYSRHRKLPQNQNATIDIVIDRSAHRKEEPRNNSLCPDLSDLLNEIGLPEDTATGNPFMHSPQKPYEISFQNSLAASLPGLEVTGERIPTPKNWSREECSEIIVQDPADDNLYGTHDVETPYMVESWLKDTFLDFSA